MAKSSPLVMPEDWFALSPVFTRNRSFVVPPVSVPPEVNVLVDARATAVDILFTGNFVMFWLYVPPSVPPETISIRAFPDITFIEKAFMMVFPTTTTLTTSTAAAAKENSWNIKYCRLLVGLKPPQSTNMRPSMPWTCSNESFTTFK